MLCAAPVAAQTAPSAGSPARWAHEFMGGRDGASAAIRATNTVGATSVSRVHRADELVGVANAGSLTAQWMPVGPMQVETAAYGKVTGRVTAVAFDPTDTSGNTAYVGTTGGGVWKSVNVLADAANVRFTPLMDSVAAFGGAAPSISIGALAVLANGVVLAGTGDTNDATDSYYGRGVLRSADGGATWTLISAAGSLSFAGEGFSAFAQSSVNPALVVAAVSHSAEGAVVGAATKGKSARGLYYSTDYGQTWQMSSIYDGAVVVQNAATSFSAYEGNAATAVVWNAVRAKFYAAVRFHGVYESSDAITWKRLPNQPGSGLSAANCPALTGVYGSQSCPMFRSALAVQPTTGDMFALTVDVNNADTGLFQDACARSGGACSNTAVLWGTQINAAAIETGGAIVQGDYNLTLAAAPWSGDTLLFAGTTEIFRCSLNGGCLLRNTTNALNGCAGGAKVAPAQHAMAWAGTAMLFGNDGGVWRSMDGVAQTGASCSADDATHFQNLNGGMGSLAEVHAFASDPRVADTMLVALGPLGSASTATASSLAAWTQISTGESGMVAIDPVSTGNWLVQSGSGVAAVLCAKGSGCVASDFAVPAQVGLAQTAGDAALVSPPFLLDPTMHTNLVVATCRVWRGDVRGGLLWTGANAMSAMLAGPSGSACDGSQGFVRSLAAGGTAMGNAGSPVMYAGLAGAKDGGGTLGGHVFATLNAGGATSATVWLDRAGFNVTNDIANAGKFNPDNFDVSDLATDPHDATGKTVYATVMGFGSAHVYRSMDAGATWADVSSNLPNAPANAVVVDPSDAATVYVATDAGVYVTQAIATCSTSGVNCWQSLGSGLPIAPVVALEAQVAIAARGSAQKGVLRAGTYGRGVWEMPLLTAGSVAAPVMTASPASLMFGAQGGGTSSTAQTVSVANTGNAPLVIASVAAGGEFAETDTCAGATLPVNGACTVSVVFTPTGVGARSGAVTIVSNVAAGTSTVGLAGTGSGVYTPALLQTALAFADTRVGASSGAMTLTVLNSGTGAGPLATPVVSGADFALVSNGCGVTLAAGARCDVGIVFKPNAMGMRTGSVSIAAGAMTLSATLSGNGTSSFAPVFAPAALAFVDTRLNMTSAAVQVVLTNNGLVSGTIGVPVVSGADFAFAGTTCGATLSANASCTVSVMFSPSAVGARTGTLTMTSSAGVLTLPLSGNGVGIFLPFLSARALVFPDTALKTTSAPLVVTVTNAGTIAGNVASPATTSDFQASSNGCSKLLAPGATCTFGLVFKPSALGARVGGFQISTDIGPLAGTVQGNGTGVFTPVVSPLSVTFADTKVGTTTASLQVKVTNSGALVGPLGVPSINGDDFSIAANTCGAVLSAGASCAVDIAFKPMAVGARSGTLSVNAGGTVLSSVLSGNGTATAGFAPSLSPSTVVFPGTALGSTSAAVTLMLSNGGSSPGSVGTPVISGADFVMVSNACGATLAAGASCSVTVAFKPATAGARSGSIAVATGNGTLTSQLSGNGAGTFTAAVSPGSLVFGSVVVGSTSGAMALTISNSGAGAGALGAPVLAGDFAVSANTCGSSLAAGASCALLVVFKPTATGARNGSLQMTSDSGTISAALSGTGAGSFVSAFAPASLSFPDTRVGSASASLTLTLANSGTTTGAISAPVMSNADFAVSATTCGATLGAGASCTMQVAFSPTAVGARAATISISTDGGTVMAAMSGNGTGTFLPALSQTLLTFAKTDVGATSSAQVLTVTNGGTTAGAIGTPAVTGEFSVAASTCGSSLSAGASCAVSIAFKPAASGIRTGILTIKSNAGDLNAALNGTASGAFVPGFTPGALSFGSLTVGKTSAVQNIVIANTGTVSGGLGAVATSGDFAVTANTCGATLASNSSCTVSVVFKPTASGVRTGSLTVQSDAGMLTAALSGSGTTPATDTLSATTLSFASTLLNTTSYAQTLTLRNDGDEALTLIDTAVLSGDFAVVSGCGTTLAGHSSCAVSVTFTPRSVGLLAGVLRVTDAMGTQTVQLSGTGIAPAGVSLAPASLAFGVAGVGQSSPVQMVTLTNNGGVALTISGITISGDFGFASGGSGACGTGSLAAGASCQVAVAFVPQAAGVRSGAVTLTTNAAQAVHTVSLTGTGFDFAMSASGATTRAISTGGTATFVALLTPAQTMNQAVTLSCAGAPSNSKCVLSPASTDLTAVQTITVTITTGVTSGGKISTMAGLLLLPMAWMLRRRRRLAALLTLAIATGGGIMGCGAGRQLPAGYGQTTPTPVTPSGGYPIVVTAASAGLTRSVTFNLTVQ